MITICPNCGLPSPDGAELLRCAKCGFTKEFITYHEFAKLTGASECTVRRWVKSGRVKAVRLGRLQIYIHRSQYDKLMGLSIEKNQE